MKNKFLIIIFSIQLLSLNIHAVNPFIIGNTDCGFQKNDTLNNQLYQLISDNEKRIEILENDLINNESFNNYLLPTASFIVAFISLLFVVLISGKFFITNKKLKATLREVKDIEESINKKLNKINSITEEIKKIDNRINGTQTYIQQGLECNFNLLDRYFSQKSNNDFLNLLFEKREIINLYSLDNDMRFAGIVALSEKGKITCISHLEQIILNPDETDKNKLLATDAIANIKNRTSSTE